MPDDADPVDIDLLAASLRADAGDLGAFVESLAAKLEDAIPGKVRVDRRRSGGWRGPKLVHVINVDLGDQRLTLRCGRSIETSRAKLSAGIVLKNEELDTDAWLAALGAALAAEARRSETTRQALQRLLI
jgi:hypothetical protein